MSSPQLPTPSGPPDSPVWDVLLYLLTAVGGGGLIAAWLRWFAARSSTPAQLQEALNGAFSALTKELQEERAQLIARISELETEKLENREECLRLAGEIRGLKQSRDSLLALLRRSKVPIPGEADPD